MMFNLVVRYLGFLKRLPLMAWMFDAMLMIWNMLFNPQVSSSIESLEARVSEWPSVNVSIHKFGGRQFNVHQKEIGHVHSNGVLDLIFDRATKAALLRSCAAKDHHVFKDSGWISFYIRSEKDVDKALELLALSYRRTVEKEVVFLPGVPDNKFSKILLGKSMALWVF